MDSEAEDHERGQRDGTAMNGPKRFGYAAVFAAVFCLLPPWGLIESTNVWFENGPWPWASFLLLGVVLDQRHFTSQIGGITRSGE